jgi:cyclopropane-fatty-acyl-phospholipid synthase
VKQKLLEKILQAVGAPPIPIALWNGEVLFAEQASAPGRVAIRDRSALLRLLVHPDLEYGRLYAAGRLDVEGDLVACLEAVYHSVSQRRRRALIHPVLAQLRRFYQHRRSRSRDNVYRHYDIGNDFYRLWLDRQLVYTCAYFPDPATSLEDAQIAKMEHVCRKLRLQPGEEVVEAGCGWGALALHMARHYGVRVKAYNLSHEQIAYARQWAQDAGLDERVTFIEGDYREISGRYDVFVSVGMLEHVGPHHYRAFGRLIDACLKDTGRGLIHSIGRNVPEPFNPWVERYIFPGAYPPTLGEMNRIFEAGGLSVLDVENLRLHYARTLEHWLSRYESVFEQAVQMYDLAFARAWRLYLAGSTAAFRSGYLQLFQVAFARADNNEIPWTRDYLYRD